MAGNTRGFCSLVALGGEFIRSPSGCELHEQIDIKLV